jgi:hypothetical protein
VTDDFDIPSADNRFPDGGHFKLELVPRSEREYERIASLSDEHDVWINRITDVEGTSFDTDKQIKNKVRICRENDIELLVAPGHGEQPGDVSQQLALDAMQHGKIRGMDRIIGTMAEVKRAVELGVRGLVFYDEGLLHICCQLREESILPSDMTFKLSSIFSIGNPSSLKYWNEHLSLQPSDSINPVRDLTLPMMAAMRAVTDQPLDIHAFWRKDIARTIEIPEIVRTTTPVYLKNARNGPDVSIEDRFQKSVRLIETLDRDFPDASQAESTTESWGRPAEPDRER